MVPAQHQLGGQRLVSRCLCKVQYKRLLGKLPKIEIYRDFILTHLFFVGKYAADDDIV